MFRQKRMANLGFTLIEILVVIVIIGILATMGIGKYAQFSRDARKTGCVNNQNSIDKAMAMWESKYVNINPPAAGATHEVQFYLNGKKHSMTANLPSRMKSTSAQAADEIYAILNDEVVFVCPETVAAFSGLENVTGKDTTTDYKWLMYSRSATDTETKHISGKKRGVGCMVWGTIATSGTSDRGVAGSQVPGGDGTVGPSGSSSDLHSGKV